MTANASDTDRALCLDAGMDGFIAKPVTLARLSAAIGASVTPQSHTELTLAATTPVVDRGRRSELVEAFGEAGLRELDDSFFEDMAGILRNLGAALATHDAPSADRALHTIKGTAANLGFNELAAFADQARSGAVTESVQSGIATRFDALRQARERAQAA